MGGLAARVISPAPPATPRSPTGIRAGRGLALAEEVAEGEPVVGVPAGGVADEPCASAGLLDVELAARDRVDVDEARLVDPSLPPEDL